MRSRSWGPRLSGTPACPRPNRVPRALKRWATASWKTVPSRPAARGSGGSGRRRSSANCRRSARRSSRRVAARCSGRRTAGPLLRARERSARRSPASSRHRRTVSSSGSACTGASSAGPVPLMAAATWAAAVCRARRAAATRSAIGASSPVVSGVWLLCVSIPPASRGQVPTWVRAVSGLGRDSSKSTQPSAWGRRRSRRWSSVRKREGRRGLEAVLDRWEPVRRSSWRARVKAT